jgi:hypothetical protein
VDRRIDERHSAGFQVRVTEVEAPDFSASGQVVDLSEAGIGVYLPLQFMPGSAVRLKRQRAVWFCRLLHTRTIILSHRNRSCAGSHRPIRLVATPEGNAEEAMPDVEWLEALR